MSALVLDPSQRAAVDVMVRERLAVVTGGPGVGKSTCLRTALDELDARGERYRLASPTGKAAKRMHETTGREACTVHRLLEYNPGEGGFQIDERNPLDTDVVFIDESSMLDVHLAAALFAGVGPRTRLVLIGDANQLPSVGPGRVFAEVIESGRVPVARLTQLHRSAAQAWVSTQAPRILAGELPDLAPRPDFEFLEHDDPDLAFAAAVDVAARRRAQVLVSQNERLGVDPFNKRLQQIRNPDGIPAWKIAGVELRCGDAVIHTKNDYGLGVMNGETGTIVDCDKDALVVDYGDEKAERAVTYTRDQASPLRLAYALTVHKSQGSEFPWVVLFCHSTHTFMLTRQLFYTGITRAREGVVLVGDRVGIERAVKQTRDAERMTALRPRIEALVSKESPR